MTAAQAAAWGHAGLSAAVMAFHLAALVGVRVGRLTMGGRRPGKLPWAARALSAVLIVALAAVVLGRGGVLAGPRWSGQSGGRWRSRDLPSSPTRRPHRCPSGGCGCR